MSETLEASEAARTLFVVQETANQLGISAHTLGDAIRGDAVGVQHINVLTTEGSRAVSERATTGK